MLNGIRVIEIGQVLSAPYAAAILGDLGAEVIKVERPEGGDDARRMGTAYNGSDSLTFLEMNRNKLSVTIDLKTVQGRDELHQLISEADILIHNLRPGIVEELELDGPRLCARYPRLVYCEISGFGDRGPLQSLGGFEPIAQAYSGLISVNGAPGSASARVGASVVDLGTAMWIAIGAISAIYRRTETGLGCRVTASLLETSMNWIGSHVSAFLNQGRLPARLGTGHPTLVPYQAFATTDGEILIAAGNDRLFEKLSIAVGHPEWATNEKYSGNRARLVNRPELVGLIAEKMATNSKAFWFEKLTRAGVPCAPVNTIPEAIDSSQVSALELMQTIPGTHATVCRCRFDLMESDRNFIDPRRISDHPTKF